jgi:Tol biopolymer transport system component
LVETRDRAVFRPLARPGTGRGAERFLPDLRVEPADRWRQPGDRRALAWKPAAGRGGHLWRVDRQKSGWSKPVLVPNTVNRWDSTFSPAIASDGSLYFMAATGKQGHFQLYCAAFRHGAYQPPHLLPFSAGGWGCVAPAISPDRSFLVFASNRPPTPANNSDVFIAFRDSDGRWSRPVDLRPFIDNADGIDELRLGPDGHTLYFTTGHIVAPTYPKTLADSERGLQQMRGWNNGNDNIWEIDLAPWLRCHGRQTCRDSQDHSR